MIRCRQIYFEAWFIFTLLFLVHRLVTFSDLRPHDLQALALQAKFFFVGFLSDVWVAQLLALVLAGLSYGFVRLGWGQGVRWLLATVLVGSAVGLAGHQVYVSFFKFALIPFHVLYLGDASFVQSNLRSIFGGPILAHGFALILAYWLLRWVLRPELWSRYTWNYVIAGLFFGTLLAHNRNIEWRVQWFVPEALQTHFLENLAKRYVQARPVEPLSLTEKQKLQELKSLRQSPLHPIAPALQKIWQRAVQDGKKPIFLILLMESMRPAESKYFAEHKGVRDSKDSLTPELDALAGQAVVFYQAYGSGSVTRGGQEAVFCGQLSSRDTSMMRGGAVRAFPCLPDLVKAKAQQSGSVPGFSFWYHGGHPGFDNQKSFWASRQVADLMSQDDFGSEIARTDWGVGDLSFLQKVSERLSEQRQAQQSPYLVGMALTVSHHIPWGLPADSSKIVAIPTDPKVHPSYRTAAYADGAIGEFLRAIKQKNLWQDMLMVVVSDHGNSLAPYHELYEVQDPYADLRLQSHVQLILSGGIVEQGLASLAIPRLDWQQPVSQVDIPALFAYLQGWGEFPGQGENPLVQVRHKPILSQLENALFAPILPARFVADEYRRPPAAKLDDSRQKTLMFYRSYLNATQLSEP